jgi:peptidoglycan/LPS O-acetylase OafA/YrhL
MDDDRRYLPPTAELLDVDAEREIAERPRQVRWATVLLWLSFTLGTAVTAYDWRQATGADPSELAPATTAVIAGFTVALFALNAFLNVMVYQGRNWARIVYLGVALLGVAFFFLPGDGEPESLTERVAYAMGSVLDLAAMALVFTRPGSLWFRRRR